MGYTSYTDSWTLTRFEQRRKTLLVEMQKRKKIGGITDRRFGENDPMMTPEEKALERFVKEKQRGNRKGLMFDLENDEENVELTHLGESLSFGHLPPREDFKEVDISVNEEVDSDGFLEEQPRKRRRISEEAPSQDGLPEGEVPSDERRKTKKEVMEEVIAKSKLHKYERQQAKEDDDDLRAELDKGLPDLFTMLQGNQRLLQGPPLPQQENAGMNPDRMALLNGKDRLQADKEYDERLRQMAMDQRAKPSGRTLTDEEKVQQEAQRLKELEEKRLQRMRGDTEENEVTFMENSQSLEDNEDADPIEHDPFGLGTGLSGRTQARELDVEEEDDFVIEDDLIASGSEGEFSDADSTGPSGDSEDDDPEFVQGLLSNEDIGREGLTLSRDQGTKPRPSNSDAILAYTYPCPQTHQEFLDMSKDIALKDLPTVVQRVRALYHPKLANENKAKLGKFATVLVDHIAYIANQPERPPFITLELLIRHVHSLAKTYPEEIGRAFRSNLKSQYEQRSTLPTPGDLVILTAIASIFPTSDHFHQVVTPAMLCMGQYLSQKIPMSLSDLATGTYITTLCLQYQRLSKRYIPEIVNYVLNSLYALAPVKAKKVSMSFPQHLRPESFQLRKSLGIIDSSRALTFWDVVPADDPTDHDNQTLKVALLNTQLGIIEKMMELWAEHSAFCEVFDQFHIGLRFLESTISPSEKGSKLRSAINKVATSVHAQLRQSLTSRKPLRLHNHRPLAIKTSVPKFEESYNPDKHYDPDRDRAESSKLIAEHKRERKGALRELRKDANFIARESLREKKEKDLAYEKKYKRLINEIQGEEGREAKNYEREKRLRKSKR